MRPSAPHRVVHEQRGPGSTDWKQLYCKLAVRLDPPFALSYGPPISTVRSSLHRRQRRRSLHSSSSSQMPALQGSSTTFQKKKKKAARRGGGSDGCTTGTTWRDGVELDGACSDVEAWRSRRRWCRGPALSRAGSCCPKAPLWTGRRHQARPHVAMACAHCGHRSCCLLRF